MIEENKKYKDILEDAINFIDEMATNALGPELRALYKVKLHLRKLQTTYRATQYEVYKEESGMAHGWYRSSPIEYETYPTDKRRIIEVKGENTSNGTDKSS
jgi:hypothetical protein